MLAHSLFGHKTSHIHVPSTAISSACQEKKGLCKAKSSSSAEKNKDHPSEMAVSRFMQKISTNKKDLLPVPIWPQRKAVKDKCSVLTSVFQIFL